MDESKIKLNDLEVSKEEIKDIVTKAKDRMIEAELDIKNSQNRFDDLKDTMNLKSKELQETLDVMKENDIKGLVDGNHEIEEVIQNLVFEVKTLESKIETCTIEAQDTNDIQ